MLDMSKIRCYTNEVCRIDRLKECPITDAADPSE